MILSKIFNRSISLLHLMAVIAHAHDSSAHTTCLMHVKNSYHAPLKFVTLIVWDIGMKKMKERTKTSKLIVDHFSLTFVNLSLA